MSELEKRLLDMLEKLLSLTESHIDRNGERDEQEAWKRISAETADIRDGKEV